MALRVARGLFRLWVVASVLWVAGVGIETWRSWPVDSIALKTPLPPEYVIDIDPNEYLAFKRCTDTKSENECTAILKPSFDPSKVEVIVWDKMPAIQFGVMLALAPPILILAFGSALAWALRGFRP
jgi:hypothetical protein